MITSLDYFYVVITLGCKIIRFEENAVINNSLQWWTISYVRGVVNSPHLEGGISADA